MRKKRSGFPPAAVPGYRPLGRLSAACFLLGALILLPAVACPDPAFPDREIRVGVFDSPPFAMKNDDGQWEGIAVDLWNELTRNPGPACRFEEMEFEQLLEAVEAGTIDVGLGAVSILARREKTADFSQPFFLGGMGIAVPRKGELAISASLVEYLLASNFMPILLVLLLFSLVAGLAMWLAEKKRNPEEFHPGMKGWVDGIWWASVTVTTVGYGEKTPKSIVGRIIGMLWMLVGIVILALVTAAITSTITINELGYRISGPEALHKFLVGTVKDTAAAEYLKEEHIHPELYEDLQDAFHDLEQRKIDAVVFDRTILRYYEKYDYRSRIEVLKVKFDPQNYGFIFPLDSPLRKPVNILLLELLEHRSHLYDSIVHTYVQKVP